MTARSLALGLLLGNLEREMRDLAQRCRALQSAAADSGACEGSEPAGMVIALQDLDPLTQIIEDLSGLACEAAHWPLARLLIDPGRVNSALRLESLARRLLAPPGASPSTELDDFLL